VSVCCCCLLALLLPRPVPAAATAPCAPAKQHQRSQEQTFLCENLCMGKTGMLLNEGIHTCGHNLPIY
jgi:hypothetical protein